MYWLLYHLLCCMGNTSFPCCIWNRKIPGQRDADAFNKDYGNPTQSPEQVLRPKLRGVDFYLEI